MTPITEMALPIRVEDRTGDTSSTAKRRQRADPPHILLTTPESLALLLSYEDAPAPSRGSSASSSTRSTRCPNRSAATS
jgi:ATP-dependent helicase Lhr and Lhr-like helicase